MHNIQAICFDLDDTLWDLSPVIPRAERTLYSWYAEKYPRVVSRFTAADILQLRQRVAEANPELAHDLTALRMQVLQTIARESDYPEACAAEAFAVFQKARNEVELYADVLPAFALLSDSVRLFALSNGNADLHTIGIAQHFEQAFSARELGVAKPDTAVFHAVCEQAGLAPQYVAHAGDHPENDIVGAQEAGMPTIWVNRKQAEWTREDCQPDIAVDCLLKLAAIVTSGNADSSA